MYMNFKHGDLAVTLSYSEDKYADNLEIIQQLQSLVESLSEVEGVYLEIETHEELNTKEDDSGWPWGNTSENEVTDEESETHEDTVPVTPVDTTPAQ
jgi:hypothetical protein